MIINRTRVFVILFIALCFFMIGFEGVFSAVAEQIGPPEQVVENGENEPINPDDGLNEGVEDNNGGLSEDDIAKMTPEEIYQYLQEIRTEIGKLVSINEEQQEYWLTKLLKEDTMPLILKIAIETAIIVLFVGLAFLFFKKRIAKFIELKRKGVDDVTAQAEAANYASEESRKIFEQTMEKVAEAISEIKSMKEQAKEEMSAFTQRSKDEMAAFSEQSKMQIKEQGDCIREIAKSDKSLVANGVSEKIIKRLGDE